MISYDTAEVIRLKDKGSISHPRITDRIRSFLIRSRSRIFCESTTIFKENVLISISRGGRLEIGGNCLLHRGVVLLLTLPHPNVTIGNSVFIGKETIIAAKNRIQIGDFTIFAPRCYIIDHEHGFSRSDLILNQRSVLKEVIIGRDCYFGTGTVILGGVTIGDGAIVGANSVVSRSIPAGEIWAGNPAKFIRPRS
jgi:acetyltransferase-like isoleucine patch superfamily enzyme